ncbi:hypothetical protein roselon_03028 [Roseibacterium elongatum DSM 19469]|uniref:Uncharacterized protein n=1 Tax=Roseicyclus elongatus DSM 19469 TaxID=1294273 RepID=W8RVR6_9RHOB|nr:hypothetical protein roselon_03028 [Roseibacterium elongatum DSM 19469]
MSQRAITDHVKSLIRSMDMSLDAGRVHAVVRVPQGDPARQRDASPEALARDRAARRLR